MNFVDPLGLDAGLISIPVSYFIINGLFAITTAYYAQQAINQMNKNKKAKGGMFSSSAGGSCPNGDDDPDDDRNPSDDKRLTKGDIKKLKKSGYDPHDIKPDKQGSRFDLFKDRNGNVYVKPKSGIGHGDSTGINIFNL